MGNVKTLTGGDMDNERHALDKPEENPLIEAETKPHWEHYVLKFINLYPHGEAPYWTIHYTEEIAKATAERHAIKIASRIEVSTTPPQRKGNQ